MKTKLKIFNSILSIIAPILLIVVVVFSISYAWYTNRQQIANIDATTKNVAVEYTFDKDTEKNVLNYSVSNIAFFDADSEDENKIELKYLPSMAVKLTLKLKNNSSNNISYKITFDSLKDVLTEKVEGETVNKSIAYIDCLFYDVEKLNLEDASLTTVNSIKDLDQDGIEYASNDTKASAIVDSSKYEEAIVLAKDAAVTVDMYLYGVQEIDSADSDDFLYETKNNVKTLKSYDFTLTIESIPLGEAQVEIVE